MGNTVSRAGLEPTSLAFWASVLPLYHVGSLISLLYACPPVYAASCLRGQCRLLYSSPWNCKPFNAYNYIRTYTYTRQVQQPYSAQLVLDHGHGNQCCGCDENGKYCAQGETQSYISSILGQCATITPCRLPDVTTIPTPACLCNSLPQRSVQTTTLSLDYTAYKNLPNLISSNDKTPSPLISTTLNSSIVRWALSWSQMSIR